MDRLVTVKKTRFHLSNFYDEFIDETLELQEEEWCVDKAQKLSPTLYKNKCCYCSQVVTEEIRKRLMPGVYSLNMEDPEEIKINYHFIEVCANTRCRTRAISKIQNRN